MGAYKRTPRAIIKREAAVPPLDIYIDITAMQRAAIIQGHPVEKDIYQVLKCIQGERPCVADSVNRGMSTARGTASLYDRIVYKQGYQVKD